MDEAIRKNYPESTIVLGELLPGIDGKYRYLKTMRLEMFREWFVDSRLFCGGPCLYCVWKVMKCGTKHLAGLPDRALV